MCSVAWSFTRSQNRDTQVLWVPDQYHFHIQRS
jgi:hypothetical protein